MSHEGVAVRDAQQAVQDAGVPWVDFLRLNLPFLDVLMPGLKLPDHEGACEDIQIGAVGFIRQAHGMPQFRAVTRLSVIMGQHGPEAPHRGGGYSDPELWDVS